jgi:hypothetical protein
VTVVAIIPAKDSSDSIADTIGAVRSIADVHRVLVVDDGSSDRTGAAALAAGADVLRLPVNVGKGAAVRAGVDAAPEADIYLLLDADLGATAAHAGPLLRLVVDGDADLAIGVLPGAGRKGGFGAVRTLAARGIKRASGYEARAPLSGQRAVRASLVRNLESVARFGLEVGMTIDAVRAHARVVEVEVPMDHRHTGRSVAGFTHRARQGADVVRSLWPRLTSRRMRIGAIGLATLLVLGTMAWMGTRWEPSSAALAAQPKKIVVFGMGPMSFDDIQHGHTPVYDSLLGDGGVAAMSVRTYLRHPSNPAGYLSLGAGSRLNAPPDAGLAFDAGTELPGGTAGDLVAARTGEPFEGDIAVVGGVTAVKRNASSAFPTHPGALGDALAADGFVGAAVGNADQPAFVGPDLLNRPTALATMGSDLAVPVGTVSPSLLVNDGAAPFGVRADPAKMVKAFDDAAARADVVVVDPGDLERADRFRAAALGPAVSEQRTLALERTDAMLGEVRDHLPPDTLLLVVTVATPNGAYRLTPFVAVGPGVPAGYAVSPSTKRLGIVAITDIAPTIIAALGADVPSEFPGNALRYHAGSVDYQYLRNQDRDTDLKERTYYAQAVWFIIAQAVTYLLAMFVVARRTRVPRLAPALRFLVLTAAAFPLATFLVRLIPNIGALGTSGALVPVGGALAIGLLATRARRNPLSPLSWIMAASVLVVVYDVCTGTWLHVSSWLGYSLHSAGRFYGIPNTTFALLASGAVLLACAHVQFAPRRKEAVAGAIALLTIVLVADGAPSLGGDVGGIVTLVPLFGLTAIALAGRRIRLRTVAIFAAVTAVALSLATAIDLARPADQRTHLGRFASNVFNDPSDLLDTFLRKQGANFRILQASIWTWMLPVAVVFVLYLLVWERQWSELLPSGSPVRVGAIAVPAGALLGFASNDSGPIVLALFFVFYLPFLTLLALHRARGEPLLLRADDAGVPAPVGAATPLGP